MSQHAATACSMAWRRFASSADFRARGHFSGNRNNLTAFAALSSLLCLQASRSRCAVLSEIASAPLTSQQNLHMTIRVASWPAPRTPIAPPYIDPPPPPPAADAASLAVVRARFLEHSLIRPLAADWAPRTPSSSQTRRGSVARAESALAITERDEAEIAAAVERAQAQLDARAVKTAKRVGPYSPLFAKLGIAEDEPAGPLFIPLTK